ncbi:MAG: hypothetical protein AVDCRST_MAG37-1497 [uncultured Rubrobacteraceae bacterium]|uniref:Uncharacterized protein n=1 Tax=uncultured Rubrobacteraceae bacterium TaxID=349277 RepID=A0A6J4QE96_9ACTN|nr:MAG: hypothetical protein AVDCRST_MAG37-1497 [uncultured Rubrobacteraceae bacterium]
MPVPLISGNSVQPRSHTELEAPRETRVEDAGQDEGDARVVHGQDTGEDATGPQRSWWRRFVGFE